MTTAAAIEIQALGKIYGEVCAVSALDLNIRQGEVLSLLGPNGAGKSTTIGMLSGLIAPSGGDARIMGHSITTCASSAKKCIGVVPQEIAIYEDLSAEENLVFWGRMYGLSGPLLRRRVEEALEMIALRERRKDRSGTFSGGMKRRLNIAIALLHQPPVVIMDEPTVGIDPHSRRRILDSVKELRSRGTTVLYTTHYMEEAEELSDRIAIMDRGTVVAQGTYADLIRIVGGLHCITLSAAHKPEPLLNIWRSLPGVDSLEIDNSCVKILTKDSRSLLPALLETAIREGAMLSAMEITTPNLESVFLHLTGKALRD